GDADDVPEGHARRERRLARRERIALERQRVRRELHLVHRQQTVAIGVLVRVRNRPVAAQREAFLVALGVRAQTEDDRRDRLARDRVRADLDELVVVRGERRRRIPEEVLALQQSHVREHLDAAIPHLTQVLEARRTRAQRRRQRARDERITRDLVVERELEAHAIGEQTRIEAQLQLRRLLGLQVDVASTAEREPGLGHTLDGDRDGIE